MKNKDFYAYCKQNRKTETDPNRRTALADLYQFMWECGISKSGVAQLVTTRVDQATQGGKPALAEAYTWLLGVFQGQTGETPAQTQENGGSGSEQPGLWD